MMKLSCIAQIIILNVVYLDLLSECENVFESLRCFILVCNYILDHVAHVEKETRGQSTCKKLKLSY